MSGKNKIVIIIMGIFAYFPIYAQNLQILYKYTYQPDSLKENFFTENMVLNNIGGKSIFRSDLAYSKDSLIKGQISHQIKIENISPQSQKKYLSSKFVTFSVEKDFTNQKVFLIYPLGQYIYRILQKESIIWKLYKGSKIINGYKSYKATCHAFGRDWTAWYTSEIPITDGPYAFSGLPGLILNIADSRNQHNFEVIGIKRINGQITAYPNMIDISTNKFKIIWRKFKDDPSADLKFAHRQISSNNSFKIEMDHEIMTSDQVFRKINEIEWEKIKHNNNPIDLSLFK